MIRVASAVICAVVAGCALAPPPPAVPQDQVILLPGTDGTTGALTVRQGEREIVLDSPYASAVAGSDGAPTVSHIDADQVRARFGDALAGLPAAPISFTVYFVFAQDELTEESRKTIGPVLQEIARRPAPEVAVIGHADQAGPDAVNDALSLRRAERVKDMLVKLGIPADRIVVSGRGSRDPLVRAPEGASEARNRRVEVSVR